MIHACLGQLGTCVACISCETNNSPKEKGTDCMKVSELAERVGARLLTPATDNVEVVRVYASDRISDLLNEVTDGTLLVTNLSNSTLVRLIQLMDVASVCLLNGAEPEEPIIAAAQKHGAALMVSPLGMYETCGRLYRAVEARRP